MVGGVLVIVGIVLIVIGIMRDYEFRLLIPGVIVAWLLTAAWQIYRSVPADPATLPSLARDVHPELWAIVDRTAAAARANPPLSIDIDTVPHVTLFQVDGGHRLTIGLPLFSLLTRSELESLIAHVFGHPNPVRDHGFVSSLEARISGAGPSGARALGWYRNAYLLVAGKPSHEEERFADLLAISAVGDQRYRSALTTQTLAFAVSDAAFEFLSIAFVARRWGLLGEIYVNLLEGNTEGKLAQIVRADQVALRDDPGAAHVPLEQRLANLPTSSENGRQHDDSRALSLLGGIEAQRALQSALFARDLPYAPWDELAIGVVPEMLSLTEATLDSFATDNTLDAALTAIDELTIDSDDEFETDAFRSAVLSALLDVHAVSVAGVNWSIDGDWFRWDARGQSAIADVELSLSTGQSGSLRNRLSAAGVDLRAQPQDRRVHLWVGSRTGVRHGRKTVDVHVLDDGLIVLPAGTSIAEFTASPGALTEEVIDDLPEVEWLPVDWIEQISTAADLCVTTQTRETFVTTPDTQDRPDRDTVAAGLEALKRQVAFSMRDGRPSTLR